MVTVAVRKLAILKRRHFTACDSGFVLAYLGTTEWGADTAGTHFILDNLVSESFAGLLTLSSVLSNVKFSRFGGIRSLLQLQAF